MSKNKKEIDKLRDDEYYYNGSKSKYFNTSEVKKLKTDTYKQFEVPMDSSHAFEFGKLFHTMVLEKDKLNLFPIYEGKTRSGKEFVKFCEDNNIEDKKTALLIADYEKAEEMTVSLLRNPILRDEIMSDSNLYEEPMIGEIQGHEKLFKCKADIITKKGLIIDLKSTACVSIDQFVRKGTYDLGYDVQAYIYSTLFNKPFKFIAVSKTKRFYKDGDFYYDVFNCSVSDETILRGKQKVTQALELWEQWHGPNKLYDMKESYYNQSF